MDYGGLTPLDWGMDVVGVNEFSSIYLIRPLSETDFNISPLTPCHVCQGSIAICVGFRGMTSMIRVADVRFYCTPILFRTYRTKTGDLKDDNKQCFH